MGWFYLILAGLCEIGWPIGLKMSQQSDSNLQIWLWTGFAALAIAISGYLLFLAQKSIPMGTAYAVWTGIGAVGAFVCGIIFFKDSATIFRVLSVLLIVGGIVGLKLSS